MAHSVHLLQEWYRAQCNGEWEHSWGIKLSTLDNPGWSLKIDLADTALQNVPFIEHKINYLSEKDWIICQVKNNVFVAHCGINQLEEMIMVFIEWTEITSRK